MRRLPQSPAHVLTLLVLLVVSSGPVRAEESRRSGGDAQQVVSLREESSQPPKLGPHAAHTHQNGLEENASLLGPLLHGRDGLVAEYVYTGEVFTNTRGGINTRRATEYRGNFDLTLTADLDAMSLAPGGVVFLYAQNGHGRGLTERHVGDFQILSNQDAFDFTQLSEYWWEGRLFGESLRLKLGKQDCNADFAVVGPAGDFIQSSFGYPPNVPMPTFPDPSLGVAVFFEPRDSMRIQVGVYDGATFCRFRGKLEEGEFSIAEGKLNWSLTPSRRRELPGSFHAGVWYHSGKFFDIVLGCPVHYVGNHGVYLGADQWIYTEPRRASESDRGLTTFAQYSWAPEDRNEAHQYVGAGLVYKGLIRARPDDLLGAGVAHVIFSDRLPDLSAETAVELFYRAPLGSWAVIQPDLQFIAQPGGNGRDALAAGLRFEIVF